MSYLFLHNLLLCLGTALYFTGYKYSEMISLMQWLLLDDSLIHLGRKKNSIEEVSEPYWSMVMSKGILYCLLM